MAVSFGCKSRVSALPLTVSSAVIGVVATLVIENVAEAPGGVFPSLLALLRRPLAREDQRRWLRRTLGRITDGADTHPAPAERLAASTSLRVAPC